VTKANRKFTSWLAIGALLFSSIGSCCPCAFGAARCCESHAVAVEQEPAAGGCCKRRKQPPERNGREVFEESNEAPAKICSCRVSPRTATPFVAKHLVYLPDTDIDSLSEDGPGFTIRTLYSCLTSRLGLTPPARAPPCATRLS